MASLLSRSWRWLTHGTPDPVTVALARRAASEPVAYAAPVEVRGWEGWGEASIPAEVLRHLETRSLTPQDLVTGYAAPRASTFDRTKALDEGLKASIWVYRCATVVALSVASVPWTASQRVGDQWKPLDREHPLQRLLRRPNPEWSWMDFVTQTAYFMQLGGEAFITKIRSQAMGASAAYPELGVPTELWAYAPDTFSPRPGQPGQPFVAEYRDNSRLKRNVLPENMIHAMFPNPSDPYRGLSPLQAAQRDVDTEVQAAEWQASMLTNLAVPPGVFSFVNGINPNQWAEAQAFFAKTYQGAKNARRPMILGREIKWLDLAKTAVDMDFIDGRKLIREGICAAFGVPPVLVGILDRATYNNFSTAELVFWKLTALPFLNLLRALFNAHLAPEYGEDIQLDYDTSGVDALLPLFKARLDLADTMVNKLYIPLSQANDRLGLGLTAFEGWDQSWRPVNVFPVGGTIGEAQALAITQFEQARALMGSIIDAQARVEITH